MGKEPKDFDIDGVLFTANDSYLELGAKIATIADLKKNSNSDANKTKEINKLKNDAGLAYTGLCGALIGVMNKAGGMAGLTAAQQQSFKDFVGCKQAAKKAGIVAVRRKKAAK